MEKYGVACGCAAGKPDASSMTKLADGSRQCPHCGTTLETIQMKDTVRLEDKEQKPINKKP